MKSRTEVVSSGRANKRFRAIEEKRRIVEETLPPGASVTAVARAHGVSRDQVFVWRRLYRQGRLAEPARKKPGLLPVRVIPAASPILNLPSARTQPRRCSALDGEASMAGSQAGVLHVELPNAHLRIAGRVDTDALRILLEHLR